MGPYCHHAYVKEEQMPCIAALDDRVPGTQRREQHSSLTWLDRSYREPKQFLYTDTDWKIFDPAIASNGRRALNRRASGKQTREDGCIQSMDQREDQTILETALCENRSQSPKAPMDAARADLPHTAKSSRQCSATYRSKNHGYQTRAESYNPSLAGRKGSWMTHGASKKRWTEQTTSSKNWTDDG